MVMKNSSSNRSNIIFWVISILIMSILFEILSSQILIYNYRSQHNLSVSQGEISSLSSINLMHKVAKRIGFSGINTGTGIKNKTDPAPFIIQDPVMGYSAPAGEYTHTILRKYGPQKDWESFKTKVTINKDGSRWTGKIDGKNLPKIYVFGDSFVFGSGVNDEQTFSFLLQYAMPHYEVKLFALGGYSLTQAYLRFESLKESINSSDIIVLGYADFYDKRHVMSPGRIREGNSTAERRIPESKNISFPLLKASLDKNGEIEFSYVNGNCSENSGYCEKKDPSSSEMTNLTAALINHISDNSKAKVYLIHFEGNYDNPVFQLINDKVTLVSALSGDFDYFIRDSVEGFDHHPGPYWHYAISRKLLEKLSD